MMRSVPCEEKRLQLFPVEVERRECAAGSAHVRTGLYISTRVTLSRDHGGKGVMEEELKGSGGQQENTKILVVLCLVTVWCS